MKTEHPRKSLENSDLMLALPWQGSVRGVMQNRPLLAQTLRPAAEWVREAFRACGAFQWVALGYLGVSAALIILFHTHLDGAWRYLVVQASVAMLVLLLSWTAQRPDVARYFERHKILSTIAALAAPQAFFLFCFEELHYLVHLILPGWFDRWLIAFDRWLVGVHPTVWLEQFARPALNDFMQMAYITYFLYLTILGAILRRRGERRAFWAVMTSSIAAYALGYIIAIFFPIESPYHALAAMQHVELTGGFFTSLIGVIERFGRVHGAAFPSAHVSGSFVAVLGAWRYRRWLFWVFLPFFVCMMVSTVYGRYHYIADVLGGLITGAIGFALGQRLMRLPGAVPAENWK